MKIINVFHLQISLLNFLALQILIGVILFVPLILPLLLFFKAFLNKTSIYSEAKVWLYWESTGGRSCAKLRAHFPGVINTDTGKRQGDGPMHEAKQGGPRQMCKRKLLRHISEGYQGHFETD